MWSLENPAIKNGIIAGISSVVLILLMYLINAKMVFNLASIVATVLFIVFMIRSVKAEKEVMDTFAFSDALKPGFLTFVVANLIYMIFYYVLLNFIAPELITMQKEIALEMLEKMSGFLGEEATEAAIDEFQARDFEFGLTTAIWSFAWGLIFPGFIIASIIALVFKESKAIN